MVSSEELSYYIISLGCSKNLVDSEKINGIMTSAGFSQVESSEEADILIINTCGFINAAKEESIEVIFDEIDKIDSRKIAVVGCLAQRYGKEIIKEIPEIAFLYGIVDDNFIVELSKKFNVKIDEKKASDSRRPLFGKNLYSYIKISEGCSNNCSYCSIPLIRGAHRSLPVDAILDDTGLAAEKGAREIIVIAQDITAYRWVNLRLHNLVDKISEIKGIEWIRLLYCHPDHISNELIDLIKRNEKVVRYIDLPFQHVSSPILKSMGRKGSFNKYYDLVVRLREDIPGIRIRSTFMIGFPGETEDDFELLLDFLKKADLDRVGGFTYSKEEGTLAFKYGDQISEKRKKKRFKRFMELQREISISKLKRMMGTEVDVIVEEKIDEHSYLGRTEFDAPEVDGVFFLTSKRDVINKIVRAKVTDAVDYDLAGVLV